jgi:large subunit ribosomal protein L9
MKVILLEEVAGQGREGDVIDVARGYAKNFLFPRKLAVEATPGNVKQLEARRANIEQREAARVAEAEGLAAQLDGRSITIEAKAGEEGRLFGSVTAQDMKETVSEQLGIELDRKQIPGHFKEIGEHEVTVRVSHDVSATLTVVVVPEGGELEDRVSFMDDAEKAAAQLMAAQGVGEDENTAEILEGESEGDEDTELSAEEAAIHVESESDIDKEGVVGFGVDTAEATSPSEEANE